jgi:hypothetical protein
MVVKAFTFHADWRGMAVQASALCGKARFGAAIRNPHETGNIFHGLSRHDVSGSGSERRSDSPTARVAISRCGWATRCAACRGAAGQNVTRTERGIISKDRRGTPWPAQAGPSYTHPRAASRAIYTAGICEASHGVARHYAAGGGNPGHFPKHQEAPATRGATVHGMT